MATFAPSAARRFAIAAPIPREPPVMRAIFPSSFLDIGFLLVSEGFLPHTPAWSYMLSIAKISGWLGYAHFDKSDAEAIGRDVDFVSWEQCLSGMGEQMELRHFRYFVAVAEAGSLTVAAEQKLHMSQPSLSRQIRDLEDEVGAQLLARSPRGIELTPAGRAFLDHARLVLAQVETAGE